jgi:hypothetical protein
MKVDRKKQETARKQPYVRPTLQERECLDEVLWGQRLISGGLLPPPPP